MRQRVSLVLSATALVVALFGSTPLGKAASRAVRAAVPPYAKTAGYAKVAGNSALLNGRKSAYSGAPGTILVVGTNGKLPTSVGAVGPEGLQGPKGLKGATGLTGYQIVTNVVSSASAIFSVGGTTATCPSGKSVLGGGGNVTRTDGSTGGSERSIIDSSPTSNHDGWVIDWSVTSGASDPGYTATVYAVCATVASS